MIDNVKCLLEVGDRVKVDQMWGPKIGGKEGRVMVIRRHFNCESGFMVTIDIYDRELDANWLTKVQSPQNDKDSL